MGAFGELLIRTLGGDLKAYNGEHRNPPTGEVDDTEIDLVMETIEDDIMYLRANSILEGLTNRLIYYPKEVEKYTEVSIKDGFKKGGFSEEIQNKMWHGFLDFKKKYIK